MDYKKAFEKFEGQKGFVKTTASPPVDGSQKAALNRKGNQLFNSGNIEGARRVFMTTGYSDGLSRVGDSYISQNRTLDALQFYWMEHDRTKADPLLEQLAGIVKSFLHEDEEQVQAGE
jgi:hypothetical protein